jgi:adenylate cyclase
MEPVRPASVERRLAAILAADVAGYSRLIETDEEATLSRLKTHRTETIDPKIGAHRGRIVKTTGDGFLVEFASVVDALRCAVEMQAALAESNAVVPPDRRIDFRIGINAGDIVVEDGDIFGDVVNIAARLESLAEPGGICVSRVVHDQVRDKLNVAFEDMGEQPVRNIARPIHVWRVRLGASPAVRVSLALPDKPSIAVLPFANLSGDPEQEYFADGMVEEIITALSRIRWLFVIARNSSFTYKGQAVDVKQVGRELGVRYTLEGSVRKAGQRVRITAQLIDTITSMHLWADRFDGSLEDVFDLQDKVASSVAGIIEPALEVAEMGKSVQRPTKDLTAYDFYLRALASFWVMSKQGVIDAHALFEQAIRLDPHYGQALSWAAVCQLRFHLDGWTDQPETANRDGRRLAHEALQAAGDDPATIANAAYALGYFGEDIDAMTVLIDRALTLNPSFARGWFLSAYLRLMAGQPDLAIVHLETSLRLSPRNPVGGRSILLGIANLFNRRFEDAAVNLMVAIQEWPGMTLAYRCLASSYAHLGRLDEAHEIIDRLRANTSIVVPSYLPWRNPEHRELFLSGLRLAAGEAT